MRCRGWQRGQEGLGKGCPWQGCQGQGNEGTAARFFSVGHGTSIKSASVMAGDTQAQLIHLSAGLWGQAHLDAVPLLDTHSMPWPALWPPSAPGRSLCSLQPQADPPLSHMDTTCLPSDVLSNVEMGSAPSPLSAGNQLGAVVIMGALTSSLDPNVSPRGAQQPGLLRHGQVSAGQVCPDRLHSRLGGGTGRVRGRERWDVPWGCSTECGDAARSVGMQHGAGASGDSWWRIPPPPSSLPTEQRAQPSRDHRDHWEGLWGIPGPTDIIWERRLVCLKHRAFGLLEKVVDALSLGIPRQKQRTSC
ncbi:uncharacterized protein LOC113992713 isoform X2 [Pipra filicauda]|uniref:Uncharacterized protein LOC113992713 isoform X2 n=1 Tax=Pipra filicauda TaxID=649802 RepID=A0A6J2HG57_9PASS|nr:uncharacterized protein LOC113992713 isoform X2 [Pipra filicauda]